MREIIWLRNFFLFLCYWFLWLVIFRLLFIVMFATFRLHFCTFFYEKNKNKKEKQAFYVDLVQLIAIVYLPFSEIKIHWQNITDLSVIICYYVFFVLLVNKVTNTWFERTKSFIMQLLFVLKKKKKMIAYKWVQTTNWDQEKRV